jgi:hypothetical protein
MLFTSSSSMQRSNQLSATHDFKSTERGKHMKKYYLWVLALVIAAGTAEIANIRTTNTTANQEITNSGAFRDGSYLGRLAADRGEAPHVAVGRWAKETDRALFAAGYNEAYDNTLSRNVVASPDAAHLAAFRDGLYLGKFDSEQGNPRHLATGRWSRNSDQTSFAEGYNQAYDESLSASAAQRKVTTRQAMLIH